MWAPLHNENALHTNGTPLKVQFSLYATLLLIGWKLKLVKFFRVFVEASRFYLSIICRENKGRMTDNNEAYDGLSVFTDNRL